jgi:acyl CoA:acetate/3-ketoacid CoA transferase alpha subunit
LVLAGASAAQSGLCAEQIAQLERQVANIAPGPQSGPTGPQGVGAQLHRQPTPGSVAQAERVANTDADDALARAKKADAEGNAAECDAAVRRAQELYGIQ